MTTTAASRIKVAFTLFGGTGWTGGINYLENLLSAIAENPALALTPVLFCGNDADASIVGRLEAITGTRAVRSRHLNSDRSTAFLRNLRSYVLQRDYVIERLFKEHGIAAVFQHGIWLGRLFSLPTIAWIADFQHHHLPHMFPRWKRLYRTLDYRLLSVSATQVMVSSHDARKDCEAFYPSSRGKVAVLPFVVRRFPLATLPSKEALTAKYDLPARYVYMPNQFWRHKNHLVVIEALGRCMRRGNPPIVVASGSLVDNNNPDHPQAVLQRANDLGLDSHFRYLGHIPYQDVIALMTHSIAMINPSLFEGWSTTVEEAKAIGVRLLLSGIDVHREQAADSGIFFDPMDPDDVARVLAQAWSSGDTSADRAEPWAHEAAHRARRQEFAARFRALVQSCLQAR